MMVMLYSLPTFEPVSAGKELIGVDMNYDRLTGKCLTINKQHFNKSAIYESMFVSLDT